MLRYRSLCPRSIAILSAGLLALSVCARAGSTPKVTTTLRVALTGSFFLNTGDQSTSEWIDLSGDVQLVVQAIPPNPVIPPTPIRVHANVAGVTGIGRTSGQHFVLNGSENFEADGDIPNTLTLQGTYRLGPEPPLISQGPEPPPIVPINFTVQVDQSGIATSASAAVGDCTVDLGCGD